MTNGYDDANWTKTGYSANRGWSYSTGSGYGTTRAADARKALEPLLDHIRQYDLLRRKLEEEGGNISELGRVTELLSHPICLKGSFRDSKVALVDQASIRTALFDVGCPDVHVDIRQLATAMPVYYFCRIRRDYWSEYSLIVEDLYQSAGYPIVDERFIRLMDGGHETYYLRLSQFRENVATSRQYSRRSCRAEASARRRNEPAAPHQHPLTALTPQRVQSPRCTVLPQYSRRYEPAASTPAPDTLTDDLLYHAGRHVFQAAWHEDQRPGMLTAAHFGLPDFSQAIELLYLCLSGELCELRQAADDRLLAFFEHTYPQPALRAFLEKLAGHDGAAINDIPRAALAAYARLSTAFSRFLGVDVPWGRDAIPRPLYKLVFANFARLEMVADRLQDNPVLQKAAETLNRESRTITDDILR